MLLLFASLIVIAFIFYGLIPGIGAFLIRGHWYRFRQQFTLSSFLPVADISLLRAPAPDGHLGHFRFFGSLESIQGNNRLWVTDRNFTVGIDVKKLSLYLLRSYPIDEQRTAVEFSEETPPDEEPDYIPWEKIYSLPSGIQIFVSGPVTVDAGQLVFRERERDPLLVIIYDGTRETLLKRCIWSARQKNEYYNPFTTVSLILGSLVLLLVSFLAATNPQTADTQDFIVLSLFSLTLSTFPVVYLLPPGVFLYFLYRYFWKRSRLLRSERDLLLLPLRYFPPETDLACDYTVTTLGNGEKYSCFQWKPGVRNALFSLNPEMKIRGSSLLKKSNEEVINFIFGITQDDGAGVSQDPMVELLCVPGNPRRLAEECGRKSKELGLVAALCIFSGLIVNFALIFIALLLLTNLF
jgi:hypothetical protein